MNSVIELPRAGGKTYDLVQEMLRPGNEDMIYVAPTREQAVRVGLRTAVAVFGAEDTPKLRHRFLASRDLPGAVRGRNARLVVDELDGVLEVLLGAPVVSAAHTPKPARRWGHTA